MPEPIKVLFLVPYPLRLAPSQRFRVELFLPLLPHNNIQYTVSTFLDEKTYHILYNKSSFLQKLTGVAKGFARRLKNALVDVHHYDYIFIHREASPIGPPVFEWLITKVWRKKVIYDYDDALWITDSESRTLRWFKAHGKIKRICKWAYKVAGGNEYLCNYARRYNKNVVLLPTSVDSIRQHNRLKKQDDHKIVIGWTGSHSTLKYLTSFAPLLQSICQNHNAELLVICNKPPAFSFPELTYLPWNECSEIDDLLKMNIGIMPLEEDKWSEGKCGFKLIQYLSLGIPAVASPVGVNKRIIENGINGFLCSTQEEWKVALEKLITHATLRQQMGQLGREKIVAVYSIQANTGSFLKLFS